MGCMTSLHCWSYNSSGRQGGTTGLPMKRDLMKTTHKNALTALLGFSIVDLRGERYVRFQRSPLGDGERGSFA
jgi:hypothetical protein